MALFCRKRLAALDLDTSDSFDCYDAMGHGLYQQRLFFLSSAFSLYVHCSILVFYLISSDVDHWCRPPADWPLSVAEWRNSAIPLEADGRPSRCTVYKYPGDPNDTDVTTCDHWDYDPKNKKRTVVSTWNLVCKRRFLIAVIQVVQLAGFVLLPSIGGYMMDRVGRRPILLLSTAAFIISTCGGCFANTFALYVTIRFFNSACVGTGALASFVLAFETTRHEYRTSYGVTVTLLALMISELWYNVVNEFNLEWFLLQAIFLSPTALAFLTFWFADESPRWLIFARNMASAEAVMLAAAKMNNVPLPITSCLLNAVKAEVLKADERARTSPAPAENSWANYIPTRALFMFGAYFSVTFTYLVLLQSSVQQSTQTWTRWLSLPSNMLTTLFAYKFIGRVPPLELLIWCFAVLGSLVCLLSLTLGDPTGVLAQLFYIPAKAIALAMTVLAGICVCEVFPTPVRATALSWSFAVGRMGGVCGAITAGLKVIGREDLALAISACMMFLSLAALIRMPGKNTGPTINIRRISASCSQSLDHMKMTLEPLDYRKPEKRRYSHDRRKSHSSSSSRRRTSFWDT